MLDNFTYTVFKFGISTFTGVWRGIYALLFLFIFAYSYFQMLKFFPSGGRVNPGNSFLTVGFICLSVC
jgi:hypothetical protein